MLRSIREKIVECFALLRVKSLDVAALFSDRPSYVFQGFALYSRQFALSNLVGRVLITAAATAATTAKLISELGIRLWATGSNVWRQLALALFAHALTVRFARLTSLAASVQSLSPSSEPLSDEKTKKVVIDTATGSFWPLPLPWPNRTLFPSANKSPSSPSVSRLFFRRGG